MKVCPTCSNQWPDDQKFCPNDGSALRNVGGTANLVGTVIGGNYHIEKKLGEGGMGAVYLGQHVKMGRKSAIKVMAVVQLGLAMMPRWRFTSPALISGTTSGTASSMRKALELSRTTQPALAASGANTLEMLAPALNKAISMPPKRSG